MESIKQGELLMLLVKRDERNTHEIAVSMGIDKSYLPKLYKMDTLPRKPLMKALQTFGITIDYFTGKNEAVSAVSEPPVNAYPEMDSNVHLQRENARLREEANRLYKLLEQEKSVNSSLAEALKNLTQKD